MNHLTDEQFADWLSGEAAPEIRSHLASCEQCNTEALQLRDDIFRYSIAMRHQAIRTQSKRIAEDFVPRRAIALHRLRWAGASVLALVLAFQTAWLLKPHHAPTPTRPVAVNPVKSPAPVQMSDDELLEAVNSDINQEVPKALAPVSAITTARNEIAASGVAATNSKDSVK